MPVIPVVPENHSHLLAEFDCLDPLLSALRFDSGRLKCTCLAVSRKWLALGTSAGGLHLIQKEGWKQRLILTHKEGSITQVACCPHDEDFIAVATSQGLVVVWELQLERRGRPERVSVSSEHRGHNITALCWDTSTLRVFVGDSVGKVSCLRAGSSKLGKGSAFVIFPIQTVTTVDSRVVQLGYQDGRLLVSSLSRCYLCDTEKEKFWRVGNKERDGEYGACFLPQSRGLLVGQPPLLYCARPGSRIWEANFNGEVLSTHQFKKLLACPPLPLITYRNEPNYNPAQSSPQSLGFPKLLYFGDQNLLTWTDSAVYIFTPQNGQVLLWTEVKDVADIAVHRNELFCLHGSGRLSHLSLLSAERCVERLLRRESWTLAATVCCMFQHTITTSRARKSIPIDRLEHLRSQLSSSAQTELINQLEEVILKMEPLDSASSSRRSSISSHESFNVLDCGIYRVISRRGSQSDEETSSLMNQSVSEEERLKEFSFVQEEDQVDHDPQSGERLEADRPDQGLQFHLPLSFRTKPPRIALQAVKDSVSSFVKKTTEKINTLQMNSELRHRPEFKEGAQPDTLAGTASYSDEMESEVYNEMSNAEADMDELRSATEQAVSQIQDPLVLLDPVCLREALMEWLPVLERILGPAALLTASVTNSNLDGSGEEKWDREYLSPCTEQQREPSESVAEEAELGEKEVLCEKQPMVDMTENAASLENHPEPIRVASPTPLPSDLEANLSELATLYTELSCFRHQQEVLESVTFLHRYFFLLDQERVRRMCLLCYQQQPEMMSSFSEAMLALTQSSKVVEIIQRGDLLKSLRSLRELQPWRAPHLLAHFHRLYEKHGEAAVRSFSQFYPIITPADVETVAQRSHFLAYLDNLVHSRAEEHRLSFLQSLLEPESLRQDWLELALTHDAPQHADTLTSDGRPRWRSHCFTWGYGRLLSLLIRLPADISSKEKMNEMCCSHGYWTGYLYLCKELQRRTEAFSTICELDDLSLLEDPDGVEPQNLDEWKLLIQLSQQYCRVADPPPATDVNGSSWSNGATDCEGRISPESLTLLLARTLGPDRALELLRECGVQVVLSAHSKLVCDLLRVAERRQRMLQEDPVLFQLYKDLVVSQVISAEEFWANRLGGVNNGEPAPYNNKQEVGISGAFLADIRPQTDGCNGLRYNLTADIIESIFRTYPAVKQKYSENVPHNLTEKEFWTRFFQSHYFHRDRINTGSQDIFSECAKQDEKGLKSLVTQGVKNPLVDLLSLEDKTLDEGYGISKALPSTSNANKSVKESSNSAIIKRFNHHSAMVLAAGSRKGDPPTDQASETSSTDGNSRDSDFFQPPLKKVKLQEAIEYEDLQRENTPKTVALNLKKSDRYAHGPVPLQSQQYTTSQDIINSVSYIQQEMANYKPNLTRVLSSTTATSAIAALSPGGVLMQPVGQQSINQMVPTDIQGELKHLYIAAGELLRHFWSCFPVNTPFLEEKVTKMKTNLERFQMTKLRPFQEKVQRQYLSTNLTGHLEDMFQKAYSKFHIWQTRRMMRKT